MELDPGPDYIGGAMVAILVVLGVVYLIITR